jgi:hypothetical protein
MISSWPFFEFQGWPATVLSYFLIAQYIVNVQDYTGNSAVKPAVALLVDCRPFFGVCALYGRYHSFHFAMGRELNRQQKTMAFRWEKRICKFFFELF